MVRSMPEPIGTPGSSKPDSERGSKDRLLDAAEREFAQHGFAAASLRTICANADISLSGVRHHFGAKLDLLRAMWGRLFDPLTDERRSALTELLVRNPHPSVEALFKAYSDPLLRWMAHDQCVQRSMLAHRGIFEHDVFWPIMQEQGRLISGFVDVLERTLVGVPRAEVHFRWSTATRMFMSGLTPIFQNADDPKPATPEQIRRLQEYAIGILSHSFTTQAKACSENPVPPESAEGN